jgi:hypothetical protein
VDYLQLERVQSIFDFLVNLDLSFVGDGGSEFMSGLNLLDDFARE